MVAIPKILTNKTVLTGITQSTLRSASIFKSVPAALDKMGQVIAPTPKIKVLGKLTKPFTADSSLDLAASQLKQPFFVQKCAVGFR